MTTFHCLFEQSGTFRDMFRSHGHKAYCYDIQDEYGKTDFRIDLFKQIENAYDEITHKSCCQSNTTIFQAMNPKEDFVMAFFPCTYFCDMNELLFTCQGGGGVVGSGGNMKRNITNIKKVIEREKTRSYFFSVFLKMCLILEELKIKTIIENPYNNNKNFLCRYSPYLPTYIEKNRAAWGDKFVKPTMYIAINFDMNETFYFYDLNINTLKIEKDIKAGSKERSEITPRYANNFYKRFIEHAST